MQTTRFLVVLGAAAAVWASPLAGYAASDTDSQAKLRDALRQKMEALDAPAAPTPTPAPAQPAVAAPTVVVPVPAEAAVAPVAASKSDSVFSDVPDNAANDAAAAKMQEAMRQKIAADPAKPVVGAAPMAPAKPAVAPTPTAPATSAVASSIGSEPAIKPAFSSGKQERLAALLQQYKAEQITPQQYHLQRAKIIAEP